MLRVVDLMSHEKWTVRINLHMFYALGNIYVYIPTFCVTRCQLGRGRSR